MNSEKILISGYYGFDNFGDDAILHMLVSNIKANCPNSQITAISNNPDKVKQIYGINSVYRFDLKAIYSEMRKTSLFISGGGSLLQDVTSLNSLIYYLGLIFLAQISGKKTYIFAQGIGPIKTFIGKLMAAFLLKKADLVTVRDSESQKFLNSLGVKSILTADPVWEIQKDSITKSSDLIKKDKINIGIQLRDWTELTEEKLNAIAEAVNLNFNDPKYKINIISLQDLKDLAVSEKFLEILKKKNSELDANLISGLTINTALEVISELDYLIAMRLHANLVSIKFNIPTLALSYDPKVTILAKDSGMPFISIESLNSDNLDIKIKELIEKKDQFVAKMKEFASEKELKSRQNIDLLIKMLLH